MIHSSRLTRRSFVAGSAAVSTAALLAEPTPFTPVVVSTVQGKIRGALAQGLHVFKGIPYAGAPEGRFRFQPAPALKPWTGIRDALLYRAQAIQPPDPGWPTDWAAAPQSEDCLFLNIWTRGVNDGAKRPVMFYSHGGGFNTGSGGADVWPQQFSHDGTELAKNYDVVVVTHNHRLGAMGYLFLGDLLGEEYAASGITGMLDIVAALKWVKENIATFGGDPENVMIWGESGGGAKTATLTAMPAAQGLYHKASVESGPTLRGVPRQEATETTRAVLAKLGLRESQAREVLTMPAAQIREAQRTLHTGAQMPLAPVVDGHHLPAHPYDPVAPGMSANIPMIVGTNKDETIMIFQRGDLAAFSLDEAGLRQRLKASLGDAVERAIEIYRRGRPKASPTDLYIAITSAQWMGRHAIAMVERKAALGKAPVFHYVFAYESEDPVAPGVNYPRKAAHAMEMAFKFNHPDNNPSAGKRPERYRAARNMSRAWATFARTGNPSHDEIPRWPAYTVPERATMFLDAECRVVNDPYPEERRFWEEMSRSGR